jgi:tetratricopeptide (TPR) repeat protein
MRCIGIEKISTATRSRTTMNEALPSRTTSHRRAPLAVGGLLLAAACAASAQTALPACGAIGPTRGDYIGNRQQLPIVERGHFTPQVEQLIRGESGVNIGGDIHYTLKSFPNHHRALAAMMRLAEAQKTPQPRGAEYTVECYFDRALRFRPDDVVARMLYAQFLIRGKRDTDAAAQLERTLVDAQDDPLTHHNVGLLYFDLKRYDKALSHAHRALALGSARDELRTRLQGVGQWREPVAAAPAASAASAAG